MDGAFAPAAPTAVSAAPDGSWVAVVEPAAITIVDPILGALHAEVAVAADCTCEVAWAGAPSRLVVVQRKPDHTIVTLVDVQDTPRPLGEIRIEQPVRVLASGALHALLVSDRGSVIVTAAGDKLAVGDFPSRAIPTAAGAFGPHHVIVAASGALEEWDTHQRQPRRRFRLPRPTQLRMVGGTDRLLWMVTQADPTRIEIFPLVNRGQPRLHELPEPAAMISGHPRVELLLWLGAESGQVSVLDLEGRGRSRQIGEPGQRACALVGGKQVAAVAAAPGRGLTVELLDVRGVEPRRAPEPDDVDLDGPTPPAPELDLPAATVGDAVDRAVAAVDRIATMGAGPSPVTAGELSQRLAGWRDRAEPVPPAVVRAGSPVRVGSPVGRAWREPLVDWTRTVLAGTPALPPRSGPLDIVAERLGLSDSLDAGIALLYGAHLIGHDGVAAADLARVLGRWDEALGTGKLAASGVAQWRRSRIRLAPVIRDALDERPPRTGELAGPPGAASSLITPCAVRVSSRRAVDAAPGLIAMAGGAYLIVTRGADAAEAILEARARGAMALLEDVSAPLVEGAIRVVGPGDAVDGVAVIEVD